MSRRRANPHPLVPAVRGAAPILPMLLASPLFEEGLERRRLTPRERQKLANVATRMQLPRRHIIYREGDAADSIYINGGGVVIAYADLPSGERHVAGFRFHADIFGLAEQGRYVNTTRAVTPVTVFRILVSELMPILQHDAGLEFQFLCKLVDELRQAQRKTIIVQRRDAVGRIAMFLDLLHRTTRNPQAPNRIDLPMTRTDIGDFLNLTLESVSRACRWLTDQRIVAFEARGARLLNRRLFDDIVAKV
jgi:CRP/FNR family transcriptional regulator, anaerobic regulatory protein